MPGKNFSRRHFKIFSSLSQKIGFNISCKLSPWGDNLHTMLNHISGEKIRKKKKKSKKKKKKKMSSNCRLLNLLIVCWVLIENKYSYFQLFRPWWRHDRNLTSVHSQMKNDNKNWETRNGVPCTERTRSKSPREQQNRDRGRQQKCCSKCGCFKKISNGIVWALETAFYK